MSKTDNDYEIVIKNKKIWTFYNENPDINIETANVLLIGLIENLFNHMTNDTKTNINAQLLSYMNENKNEIDSIKTNLSLMNENISKMNSDIANNMTFQFINLKKEYIEDVRQIINNSSLSSNEKLSSLMDKNSNHLIDKTTLILNDVIPKNQDSCNKQMQLLLKEFYKLIVEDTNKLAKSISNEKALNDFINNFETKYSAMLQTLQQPLYSFFSASENRITKNLDVLKETSNASLVSQTKVFDDLNGFLNKYKNSSNKGKVGENKLASVLTEMYSNAEINITSGIKASGDSIMKRLDKPTILFENKEYSKNIDKEEIAKFIRDIEVQNTSGVFISQYTGIAFKQNFQIDINKGNVLVYIQNCDYSADKIRLAVDIIDNLYVKIQELNVDDENNCISQEILNDINDEYQAFINQKDAMVLLVKDFQKRMTSQIEELKLPVLDKYLEPKYAYVKARCFTCELCNAFSGGSKQALSAHKRGCAKKVKPLTNTITTKK